MKVHQNVVIDGKDLGDRPSRKHSRFCNEGKWNNFIVPLLPKDCRGMTLIEFGSNAGMFLKLAQDLGFERVVGVEAQDNEYEVSLKYANCRVIHDHVDENFDYNQLPVADVVLLPNFHYHQTVQTTAKMVDELKKKTRLCIVVSIDKGPQRYWKTDGRLEQTRDYFKDWEEVGYIAPISTEGDPHPRNGMYGIAFKSDLERIPLEKIVKKGHKFGFGGSALEYVTKLFGDKDFNVEKCVYYRKVLKQKERHQPREDTIKYLNNLTESLKDIHKEGMKNPILVNKHYTLLDGGHRLLAAHALGQDSIIGRIL